MNPYEIIKRPVVTEKSVHASNSLNKATFAVHPDANKKQIREAVETLFKVKVDKVNTITVLPKERRVRGSIAGTTAAWKKAIVTLADGQKIEGI
jgi:large subunit ribosomal protein L23